MVSKGSCMSGVAMAFQDERTAWVKSACLAAVELNAALCAPFQHALREASEVNGLVNILS
jgi:hypothetical protein